MRTLTTARRPGVAGAAALVALALAGAACAPDGPDAQLAGGAEPEAEEAADESTADHADESMDEASVVEESDDTSTEPAVSDETAAETYPPNGEVVTVLAIDNTFVEEVVEVEAGTEVLWTNNGRNDHDVVPVDPTQDWGIEIEDFPPSAEYSHVFTTPGEYPYYCTIHGTETVGMIGTIVVTG